MASQVSKREKKKERASVRWNEALDRLEQLQTENEPLAASEAILTLVDDTLVPVWADEPKEIVDGFVTLIALAENQGDHYFDQDDMGGANVMYATAAGLALQLLDYPVPDDTAILPVIQAAVEEQERTKTNITTEARAAAAAVERKKGEEETKKPSWTTFTTETSECVKEGIVDERVWPMRDLGGRAAPRAFALPLLWKWIGELALSVLNTNQHIIHAARHYRSSRAERSMGWSILMKQMDRYIVGPAARADDLFSQWWKAQHRRRPKLSRPSLRLHQTQWEQQLARFRLPAWDFLWTLLAEEERSQEGVRTQVTDTYSKQLISWARETMNDVAVLANIPEHKRPNEHDLLSAVSSPDQLPAELARQKALYKEMHDLIRKAKLSLPGVHSVDRQLLCSVASHLPQVWLTGYVTPTAAPLSATP